MQTVKIFFKTSWKNAKNFCVENGMELATFETAEELQNFNDNKNPNKQEGCKFIYNN